jgi:5,6,7,8-tetrahydromethanopterin hydro-lyase
VSAASDPGPPAVQVGEAFAGEAPDTAHINTVLGPADGPIGGAWANALATPSAGHTPFMVVVRPGLAVVPPTLFVNKAAIASEVHADLTWGPAQAGVAAGVQAALRDGVIPLELASTSVLIVAVWVSPSAGDADAVYFNNAQATLAALVAGAGGGPAVSEVIAAGMPWNAFYRSPGAR